jgi:hypothetical protein
MDAWKITAAPIVMLAIAAGSSAPAIAKASPQIRVSAPPATAVAGSSFIARARVIGAVRRSRVRFLLSRDGRRSRGDRALGKPVKARRGRHGAIASRRVRLPATARGTYRLVACVTTRGGKRRAAEVRCAAARSAMRVTPAAAPAPSPPAESGTPAPGAGGPAPAPVPSVFDLAADPLSAGVTLATQSEESRVGADGGIIALTGPDGVEYELDVPEGALLTPEEITLRAVASFNGLPFAAAPLGAVVAEPAGLRLLESATLRVRPARTVPAATQAGFGFRRDGSELHLRPLRLDPAIVEIPVTILGGYGVAEATDAERTGMSDRLPTRFEDRLAHVLAPHAAQLRRMRSGLARPLARRAAASDPTVDEAVLLLMIAFDATSELIDQAVTDDAKLDAAISSFTAWYAHVAALELTAAVQPEIDSAQQRLRIALINAYRAAGARCAAGGAKLPNLARVIQSELTLRAFGYVFDAADLAKERARCLDMALAVRLTSTAGHTAAHGCGDGTSSSASQSSSGDLRIPAIELSPGGDALIEGSAQSRVTESYSSSFTPCVGAQTSCNESFTDAARPVWSAEVELGLNPGDPGAAAATFELTLDGLLTSPGPCTAFGASGVGLSNCWFFNAACKQALGIEHFGFSHNSGSAFYRARLRTEGTLSPLASEVQIERSGTVHVENGNETTTTDIQLAATLE